MSAVGTDGSLDLTDSRQFSELDGAYTFFREGDLCYAKVTPCFENGKGAVLSGLVGEMGFGSSELTVLTPSAKSLTPLLKYYLIMAPFRQLGTSWMSGTAGLQRVPDRFAKSFPFFLPPLPEQQAIANFLDRETERIDALIQKKSKFIELLEEKRQAFISHAVTKGLNPDAPMKDSGVPWLGEVPAHWDVMKLRYAFRIQTGFAFKSDEYSFDENDVRLLRGINVNVDTLSEENLAFWRKDDASAYREYQLKTGDLVLGMDRPWINSGLRAAVVTPSWNGSLLLQRVARLRGNPSRTWFTKYFFMSEAFRDSLEADMTGLSVPHISGPQISAVRMALPFDRELHALVDLLHKVEQQTVSLRNAVENSISLLREKRSALITAAVTGQIDVREEVLG